MTEEKLNRIETTLAHQERQILDLSEMINLQWKEIELLKKRLEKTQAKINILETSSDSGPALSITEQAARDKPPHY